MSDVQEVKTGVQRSPDGSLVQFGVALQNGGFFPFAAVRSGDYDEAVAADAHTQPEQTSQPDSQPTETAPPAPEQPVEGG